MKKNAKVFEKLINIILLLSFVLASFVMAFKFTFTKILVDGNSMRPNIIDGSEGFMFKTYKNSKIERFDVVACKTSSGDIIKRVVALPNETVTLENNVLYINGQIIPQDFNYIKATLEIGPKDLTLSDNQYLVIGDNRNNTIPPIIVTKNEIFAKNGFVYKAYDVSSKDCAGYLDKSYCPVLNKDWYWIKNGK